MVPLKVVASAKALSQQSFNGDRLLTASLIFMNSGDDLQSGDKRKECGTFRILKRTVDLGPTKSASEELGRILGKTGFCKGWSLSGREDILVAMSSSVSGGFGENRHNA